MPRNAVRSGDLSSRGGLRYVDHVCALYRSQVAQVIVPFWDAGFSGS